MKSLQGWCSALLVFVLVAGCKVPLYKRVDVPREASVPAENAASWGFDLGMAGSAKNVWTLPANSSVFGPKELNFYDGTSWKKVAVPEVFTTTAAVPLVEVEALPEGDALVMSTLQVGGVVVGRLKADGSFVDLSASVASAGTPTRPQVSMVKWQGKAWALLNGQVFGYDGTTFTRADTTQEAAVLAAAPDAPFLVPVGDTTWRLVSSTFYSVFADDDAKVAKLEVTRAVNGGAPVRSILHATQGDLMGQGAELYGCVSGECGTSTVITESYAVLGLVRGADDSVWVEIVHQNAEQEINELIFRRVDGDTITKDERFGIDLGTCATSKLQPECNLPRPISALWPAGHSPTFVAGISAPTAISALLEPIGELRR